MKNRGAAFSALLHLGILLLLILELPDWGRNDLLIPEPIGVEIISAKEADKMANPKSEKKPNDIKTPPQKKESKRPTPPPPPPPAEKKVEEKLASIDDFLKENPDLKDMFSEKPKKEEKKPDPKPKKKPDPKPAPKTKPKKKTQSTSDFESLLNNIEEVDSAPTPSSDELDEGEAVDLGTVLDDTELRAVERQIRSKWNEIVGSDEDIPVITVVIRINPDGTISNNSIAKGGNSRIAKLATERAMRALAHFHHNPLRLPPEKLRKLANKVIKLNFHPKG